MSTQGPHDPQDPQDPKSKPAFDPKAKPQKSAMDPKVQAAKKVTFDLSKNEVKIFKTDDPVAAQAQVDQEATSPLGPPPQEPPPPPPDNASISHELEALQTSAELKSQEQDEVIQALTFTKEEEDFFKEISSQKKAYETAADNRNKKKSDYEVSLSAAKITDEQLVRLTKLENELMDFLKAGNNKEAKKKEQEKNKHEKSLKVSKDVLNDLRTKQRELSGAEQTVKLSIPNPQYVAFLTKIGNKTIDEFTAAQLKELKELKEQKENKKKQSQRAQLISELKSTEATFQNALKQMSEGGEVFEYVARVLDGKEKINLTNEQKTALLQIRALMEKATGIKAASVDFFNLYTPGDDITPEAFEAFKKLHEKISEYTVMHAVSNPAENAAILPNEMKDAIILKTKGLLLKDLLITPAQRNPRYEMLFKDIGKNSMVVKDLPDGVIAIQSFHEQIKSLNDEMNAAVGKALAQIQPQARVVSTAAAVPAANPAPVVASIPSAETIPAAGSAPDPKPSSAPTTVPSATPSPLTAAKPPEMPKAVTKEASSDVKKMARELKAQHVQMLIKIKAEEFDDLAWTKDSTKHKSPNLTTMINYSNQIAYKIRDEILLAPSKDEQKSLFKFYVNLMNESRKIGDFFAAQAILSSLSDASLLRLYNYLAPEDSDLRVIISENEIILGDKSNYKALREAQNNALGVVVPALSPMSSDVTFNYEGRVDPETRKLIPSAQETQNNIMAKLKEYQNRAKFDLAMFGSKPNKILKQDWPNGPVMTKDEAYKHSVVVKPKGEEGVFWGDKAAVNTSRDALLAGLDKTKAANQEPVIPSIDVTPAPEDMPKEALKREQLNKASTSSLSPRPSSVPLEPMPTMPPAELSTRQEEKATPNKPRFRDYMTPPEKGELSKDPVEAGVQLLFRGLARLFQPFVGTIQFFKDKREYDKAKGNNETKGISSGTEIPKTITPSRSGSTSALSPAQEVQKKVIEAAIPKFTRLMDEMTSRMRRPQDKEKMPAIRDYMVNTLKEHPNLDTVKNLIPAVDKTLPEANKIINFLTTLSEDISKALPKASRVLTQFQSQSDLAQDAKQDEVTKPDGTSQKPKP